jgi:hypothetical protein
MEKKNSVHCRVFSLMMTKVKKRSIDMSGISCGLGNTKGENFSPTNESPIVERADQTMVLYAQAKTPLFCDLGYMHSIFR